MKKLLTFILLLCAFMQARADTWTDSNGINYELHSNGTATVISGDYSALNYVRIPSSVSYEKRVYTVTSIAANAFAGCTQIYGLTLPSTLTSIGDNAFADIPSWCIVYSLNPVPPTINSTVFPSLSNLKVAVGSVSAYQGAQGWQDMNKIIELTDDDRGYKFILHDNNTATLIRGSWEPGTIWDLSSGKIVFFDGYQDIELTITGIEPWGFTMCNDVTIVKLPPGMTTIEQGTFYQCSSLSEITIPESVTSIDRYAFYGCPLTSLTCNATTPPEVSSDAFTCYDTATLSVPMSSEAAYRNHEVWGRFNILCIATYDGIRYLLNTDGTATVFSGDYSSLTSVNIPATITSNGTTYRVTGIGKEAFAFCKDLASVTIPKGVTSIGDKAFRGCSSLTSVNIPEGVTSIGGSAFSSCSGLTSVNIPSTVTSIGDGAFMYCNGLTSVTIPEGVTSIGDDTFYDCGVLASVTIPEGVTSIGDAAFMNCRALTSVNIPSTVTSIGDGAFMYCNGLTSVTIPEGVTSIGDDTFNDCDLLASVTIPEGVTSIGDRAFMNCRALTSVNIPSTVTSIGSRAFYYCNSLTSVTCEIETPLSITEDVFSCYNTATLYVPEGSVSTYQNHAVWGQFNNIMAILDVTATIDGITYQFNANGTATVISGDYSALNIVRIPSSVSYETRNYTVTSIATNAFAGCTEIHHLTLPSTLTSIGDNAFADIPSWCRVYSLNPVPPTINSTVFPSLNTLRVAVGCVSAYQGAQGWQDINRIIELTDYPEYKFILHDNNTATITRGSEAPGTIMDLSSGKTMFFDGYQDIELTITGIEPYGFYSCTDLTTVKLPPGMTTIEEGTFYQCSSLSEITIPESVTSIGHYAFYGCPLTSLTCNATTPPEVTSDAFTCYDTATLSVPVSSEAAYQNHEVWGRFNILCIATYDGIRYLLNTDGTATVFSGDYSSLTSVNIPVTITYNGTTYRVTGVGNGAFLNCRGLTSVTIPEGVTSIGDKAFYDCYRLTSVYIPSTVTSIGTSAFYGCPLTSLTCNATTPPEVTSDAFTWYDAATLSVPEGSVSAYQNHAVWGQFNNIMAILDVTATIDGITYKFKTDGTATVIEGAATLRNANIPATVTYEEEEYTVTAIGSNAFANSSNLKNVELPSTLTMIGAGAFYGTTLDFVVCHAQTPPTLPNRTVALRPPFGNVSHTSLYVPEGRVAAYNAADGWNEFAKIFELQTTIDNIQYALIPGKKDVMVVGSIRNLTNLIIPGTVTYMGVSFDVTSIGPSAFLNNTNLRQVSIGEGVKTIGETAFSGCSRITKMTLPSTMEEMGAGALLRLNYLTTLYCNATTPPTVSRSTFNDATYANCTLYVPLSSVSTYKAKSYWKNFNIAGVSTVDGLRYKFTEDGETLIAEVIEGDYSSLTSVTIPSWVLLDNKVYVVKGICDNAFSGYTGLTSMTIAGTVTSIGSNAFNGCSGLTSLTIPESVATIGDSAFRGCSGLTSLTIDSGNIEGEGLESIGASAFRDCHSLTSVTIPSTVTSIGSYAFQGCTSLTSVTCEIETPLTITDDVFSCYDTATLFVPGGSETAYSEDPVWSLFSNILVSTAIIDGIKYSFNYNTGEATVIQSDYSGDIIIPETVTCNGVTFQVTEIGQHAFAFLPVTSVSLPSTLKTIGSQAFSFCSDLTDVTIPSSVTRIGSNAFQNCTGLTDIIIPSSMWSIGEYAFLCCTGLKSVTVLDGCTNLSNCSFIDIYAGAFQGCTSLTSVSLPASVGSIGTSAFAECTNLNTVYCEAPTPPYINSDTFSSYDTATLYVQEGSVEAYQSHEVWGLFNIVGVSKGDVNLDNEVDVADFTLLANYLLGKSPNGFIALLADVAGSTSGGPDGEIDIADMTGVANIILHSGNSSAGAPRRAAAAETDIDAMDNAIYMEPLTAMPGTQQILSVRMKNKVEVSSLEFSLLLPEGITIATDADGMTMAEMSDERTTMGKPDYFGSSLLGDGEMKILCASMSENPNTGKLFSFSGNEGEVARIIVNIPADFVEGTYAVSIVNAKTADSDGVKTALADVATSLTVGSEATGISLTTAASQTDEESTWYTLDGQKLDKKPTKRGVYIVNGKKQVVK